MNVQEMHITVEQGMQKLAANRTRKLFPEEIDWRLNRMVEKFITSAITENRFGYYEINERYAQAVAPLKETDINVPAYLIAPSKYKVTMPADFRYMVSPGVIVGVVCENQGAGEMVQTTSTRNVYAWNLKTAKASTPFWATFSLTYSGGSITQTAFPGWVGTKTNKELFQFANLMQEQLWSVGINAYFEQFEDLYAPGCLIIPGATLPLSAVVIDGTLVAPTTLRSETLTSHNAIYLRTSPGRIMRGSVKHNMRVTPYYKEIWESPLLEEHRIGNLFAYADNTYTVRGMEATYLRKPRRIDISLQRSCDLHPAYHETICNMTIQDALEMVGSPQWQQKVQVDNVSQPL